MKSVLDAVRVLDLSQVMAGPLCAMLLGDLGADVVKVERPEIGDSARGWGPPFIDGESTYFLTANRNKRSLTLNLNTPEGIRILHSLVAQADVLLINQPSRASLVKRQIDYDSLHAINPRLVYCSITAYGFTGPRTELPGYDLILQGEVGLMSLTGNLGSEPMKYPVPIADITTGIYAALAILAALYARERGGSGQFIDMALFDSQLAWLNHLASDYMNGGAALQQRGNAHASIVPYQVFRAKDKHMIVSVGSEPLWTRFCEVLGISDTIGKDPRFTINRVRNEHRAELIPLLQAIFERRPADEWLCLFREQEIPCGPINTAQEALNDPQTLTRGMIVELQHPLLGLIRTIGDPLQLSETPVTFRRPPPLLGQHTDEVLRELGESEQRIAELHAAGVV